MRERIQTVRRSDTYRKASKARNHQIRLQRTLERFEKIGGVILLEAAQLCYFIPKESDVSRALVTELAKYREELKQILELNCGKVDFDRIKAVICQRFPGASLSPLEPKQVQPERAGNSAGTGEGESTDAFTVPAVVS